jgi:uncharacterized protein YybS (DUF2232 family)
MVSALGTILLGLALALGSAVAWIRWGKRTLVSLVPVVLALWLIPGGEKQIPMVLLPLAMGFLGGYTFTGRRSFPFFLVSVSVAFSVLMTANYVYLLRVHDTDLFVESRGQVEKMMEQSEVPEERRKRMMDDFESWVSMARDILPFSTFIYGMIFSVIAFTLFRLVLARFVSTEGLRDLEDFRMPDAAIFVLIASLALVLLMPRQEMYYLYTGALNLLLITASLYMVQGFGVIRHILLRKGLPPSIIPLGILMALILGVHFTIFVMVVMAGLGTLDFWADFRKLSGDDITKDKE